MEIFEEVHLEDCPFCGGAALLEEENGWCFCVMCLDCGSHTASFAYDTPAARLPAAQKAAELWNMRKVLRETRGE